MEKRLVFAHGRAFLVTRLLISAAIIVIVAAALTLLPPIDVLPLATLVAVAAAYVVVFGFSPLWTRHWLTRSRLILRQGAYFRAIVPLAEIEAFEAADLENPARVPLGIHRPLGQPTLFVTGGRTGLIRLRLTSPRRFWQSFGLLATSIVFDVTEPTKFLEALTERRGLLAPVEAHRADP